jgi:hypothetical protein
LGGEERQGRRWRGAGERRRQGGEEREREMVGKERDARRRWRWLQRSWVAPTTERAGAQKKRRGRGRPKGKMDISYARLYMLELITVKI